VGVTNRSVLRLQGVPHVEPSQKTQQALRESHTGSGIGSIQREVPPEMLGFRPRGPRLLAEHIRWRWLA